MKKKYLGLAESIMITPYLDLLRVVHESRNLFKHPDIQKYNELEGMIKSWSSEELEAYYKLILEEEKK